MISHLSFGTSNLQRSARFYDATLGALGYVRVWTTETAVGYGFEGGNDKLAIKGQNAADSRLSTGLGFHLAFTALSQEAVDRFHATALEMGGRCNGLLGLRPNYGDSYYAAFVIDPDGHKLEAVHQ